MCFKGPDSSNDLKMCFKSRSSYVVEVISISSSVPDRHPPDSMDSKETSNATSATPPPCESHVTAQPDAEAQPRAEAQPEVPESDGLFGTANNNVLMLDLAKHCVSPFEKDPGVFWKVCAAAEKFTRDEYYKCKLNVRFA